MKLSPQLLTMSLLTWLACDPISASNLRIVVNASATEEYLEQSKDKEYHTYHVAKGSYIPGTKRDPSLSNVSFAEVTRNVGDFLASRNFFPAKSKDVGDQLILITWGNTFIDPNLNELQGITSWGFTELNANPETEAGSQQEQLQNAEQQLAEGQTGSLVYGGPGNFHLSQNIRMLGYDKGLYSKNTRPIEREKLQHDLTSDRYFFVLNAFDLPHMRETGELKELWSCRVSIKNRGTNFMEGLDLMGKVAAPTFGLNLEELMVQPVDPDSDILIGELEVLGTEDQLQED